MAEILEPTEFGKILIFMLLGVLFILVGYAINRLLRTPTPNDLKNANYECGEESNGPTHIAFNPRFYLIAIIFLLFEVELIFLFPWATVYADATALRDIPNWAIYNLTEMGIFIGLLLIGLAYVWNKGALEWVKPQQRTLKSNSKVPSSMYEAINKTEYSIRPFQTAEQPELNA
jgi:NADH-quinone oxidoreductase subunit A